MCQSRVCGTKYDAVWADTCVHVIHSQIHGLCYDEMVVLLIPNTVFCWSRLFMPGMLRRSDPRCDDTGPLACPWGVPLPKLIVDPKTPVLRLVHMVMDQLDKYDQVSGSTRAAEHQALETDNI